MSWVRQGSSWCNHSDGVAIELTSEVGWTYGKDNLVGEEEPKMKVKAVDIGKHKQDGKSQLARHNTDAKINRIATERNE